MKKILYHKKQRGSFLIELMIGLFMSLLSVLGVMTIYAQFEGQKRTTTQMSQTVSMGALAMFPIQHFGKMAGFGINDSTLLGCKILAYNDTTGTSYDFTMSPVLITSSGSNSVADKIDFLIGDSDSFFAPVRITQQMPNPSAVFKVDSRFGFREGDLVIAAEPGKDCTLAQVSNLPRNAGQTDNVIHNSGNYTDPITGTPKPTTYNKPGGLGVSYGTNGKLFNLGAKPQKLSYTIENNQLVQNNNFDNVNNKTIIGDNIVLLKAVYGLDNDNDGDVDTWTATTPTAANLKNIIAIRVGMIARSPLREKSSAGVCNITNTATFNWFGGTMDISALPDWKCYRYRLLQTTIPLRNMIWKNS